MKNLSSGCCTAALMVALAWGAAGTSQAQTAAVAGPAQSEDEDPSASQVEDIIVTAEHRSANLQSTAISITALTSEALTQMNIATLADLTGAVPGLVIGGSAGNGGNNSIALRGVSGLGQPVGSEQQVAVYLDGVYLARPEAALFDLADVQRLEVLRGPQGTLYGRNATGGAINIVTEAPTHTPHASVDASYGEHNTRQVQAFVSGGLTDVLTGSLSLSGSGHDGYFINRITGNDVGESEGFTGRAKLRYLSPGERLDTVLSVDVTNQQFKDYFINAVNADTGVITPITDFVYLRSAYPEKDVHTERDLGGVSLSNTYKVTDDLTFTSLLSSRWYAVDVNYDLAGGVFTRFIAPTHSQTESDTITFENRLSYVSDRFKAVVGVDYFHLDEWFEARPGSAAAPTVPALLPAPRYADTLEAYGVYGQINYNLTPELELVVGGRYSEESRDFLVQYTTFAALTGTQSDSAFLPKFGVNYQMTPDLFLYASVSKGFGGPGFTGAGAGKPINTFNSEFLWAYEAGVKADLLDRRLRINFSAFQSDFTDLQVRRIIGVGLVETNNASSATIRGAELEVQAVLGGGFSLRGQASYLDARYDQYADFDGTTPVSRAGNRLNRSPEWSGGANLNYERELQDNMSISANIGVTSQTESFYSAANLPVFGTDGWTVWNSRVTLRLNDSLEIYGFAKNLTDERYVTHVIAALPTLGLSAFNDPRTIGAGFRWAY